SAGASLMPSPTMPTRAGGRARASISASLSVGSRLPRTSSMPASAPMAAAVCGLSPLSIRVRTPSRCSSAMASRLLSLSWSATANRQGTLLVTEDDHAAAEPFQLSQLLLQRRGAESLLFQQAVVAQMVQAAPDQPAAAQTGQ